ncbi:hypothetical protein P7K49_011999 [Saguinus oedipus]|uniref:Uncharacterized protein n=1 Tax=Saguinus oedipus TaxID=9490 RepID=A0ABQ9VVS7_SAGOE|nr:hypothetical protein P7K49_011999 [Saguinus oedipus]
MVLPGNLISSAPHSILQGPSPRPRYKEYKYAQTVNSTSAWSHFPPDGPANAEKAQGRRTQAERK